MKRKLSNAWHFIRHLSGDDAYERYLRHHAHAHVDEPVLDRKAFYRDELERRWSGIRRCC